MTPASPTTTVRVAVVRGVAVSIDRAEMRYPLTKQERQEERQKLRDTILARAEQAIRVAGLSDICVTRHTFGQKGCCFDDGANCLCEGHDPD